MSLPRVGAKIRVIMPDIMDDYDESVVYVVAAVDPRDNAIRARDPKTGVVGDWIRWRQCELAVNVIDYHAIKHMLSTQTERLLAAFDGLEALKLRPEILYRIMARQPNLDGRLRRVGNRPRPPYRDHRSVVSPPREFLSRPEVVPEDESPEDSEGSVDLERRFAEAQAARKAAEASAAGSEEVSANHDLEKSRTEEEG